MACFFVVQDQAPKFNKSRFTTHIQNFVMWLEKNRLNKKCHAQLFSLTFGKKCIE